MDQKLPYYMAYPMTLDFEDERAERMDYEYLRSMYPEIPKTILPYVEEECDRMAYENSMIYDQYMEQGGKWLRDLTEVMLYQELFRRRSGQRRSARRFY